MYGYAPYGYADLGVAGSGAGGTLNPALPTPELTFTGGLEAYPPAVQVDIEPGYETGDQLELRYATTYANLLAGIYAGGGQVALGSPPYDFGLAAITSPAISYFRARLHRGTQFSNWSAVIMHGDADAPTFTAGPSYGSTPENTVFGFNVTTNVETTIAIVGGADQAAFTITNPAAVATSHAVTVNADFEVSGATADVQFQITNLADVTNTQSATVTITDQDEIPNAFTFTDQSAVTRSTLQTSNTITIAGLGSGITVPVSIVGGEYQKNGGAWVSTAGTATNGDTFAVRHTASAAYSTPTDTTLTVGGGFDTFTSTTEANPAVVSFAAVSAQPPNQSIGFATNVVTFAALDFPAGRPTVFLAGGLGGTRYLTNVTVDGIAATRVFSRPASDSDTVEIWIAPVASAGPKDVVITANIAVASGRVLCGSLVNAGSITPTDTKYVDPGYGGYGTPVEPATDLTVPASGLGLVCFTCENALSALNAGLTQVAADPAATPQWYIATMDATGRPGFSVVSGGFNSLLAASFGL